MQRWCDARQFSTEQLALKDTVIAYFEDEKEFPSDKVLARFVSYMITKWSCIPAQLRPVFRR